MRLQPLVGILILGLCSACMADKVKKAKHSSAGHVSCQVDEMQVDDVDYEAGYFLWQVRCPDRVFQCSRERAAMDDHTDTHCQALAPYGAQPPLSQTYYAPPPAGCTYDTQCKGTRVCRSQQCVDP